MIISLIPTIGKQVFWHSSPHILGEAMERHYRGRLCYGPPIAVADPGFWGLQFQFSAAMVKVVQRCTFIFFTFQDVLSWHIHALHCYLVHDIVFNLDDDGNLLLTKSRSFSKEVGDGWSCWLFSRAHVIHRLQI